MARQKNDGKGRIGGRAKGTPNKVTSELRRWIAKLVKSNRRQMEQDLAALEPKDRVAMLEKLMQYVIPKRQNINADLGDLTDEQLSNIALQVLNDINDNDDGDSIE